MTALLNLLHKAFDREYSEAFFTTINLLTKKNCRQGRTTLEMSWKKHALVHKDLI